MRLSEDHVFWECFDCYSFFNSNGGDSGSLNLDVFIFTALTSRLLIDIYLIPVYTILFFNLGYDSPFE